MATEMVRSTTRTSFPTTLPDEEKTAHDGQDTAGKAAALLDYHDPALGETREETPPAVVTPLSANFKGSKAASSGGAGNADDGGTSPAGGAPGVTVSGTGPDGPYSVTVGGGAWGTGGGQSTSVTVYPPQLAHPELLAVAKEDADRLSAGETVQDILGKTPDATQVAAMNDAFELLGISNRQITATAQAAAEGYVDSTVHSTTQAGKDALARLGVISRMRAAVDADAHQVLGAYKSDETQNKYSTLSPDFSADGLISAIQKGTKDSNAYFFGSDLAAHDMLFGSAGPVFTGVSERDAVFPAEFFSDAVADGIKTGRAQLGTATVTISSKVDYTPPSQIDAASLALNGGASIDDVAAALAHAGVIDPIAQANVINGALAKLGLSNDNIAALAKAAAPDIAALGPEGVNVYLSDAGGSLGSKTPRPALDKLYAALQSRFQMDGGATGEVDPAHAFAGAATSSYAGAVAAAVGAGVKQSVIDSMPIAVEEDDGPGAVTPQYVSPAGRTELGIRNETAASAHFQAGRDALGLGPAGDTGLTAGAVADIGKNLTTIFGAPEPAVWDVNSVIQTLNAGDVIAAATNGSVLANLTLGETSGVPKTVEETEAAHAVAVNTALKDRGLGNLTQEQIAKRMHSALTSRGFLDYINGLDDTQRNDAVDEAVSTLAYLDPALGQSAAASIAVARDSGVVGGGRQLIAAMNATTANATLSNMTVSDRVTAWGSVLTLALGAARQTLAATGKSGELGNALGTSANEQDLQAVAMELGQLNQNTAFIMRPDGVVDAQATFAAANIPPAVKSLGGQLLKYMTDNGWFKGTQFYATATGSLLAMSSLASRVLNIAPGTAPWSTTVGQAAGIVGDYLSAAGAAAKVYPALSSGWGTVSKGFWRGAGGWVGAVTSTDPASFLGKLGKNVATVVKDGQKWSQAIYAGQSFWSGGFAIANAKTKQGIEQLVRGGLFLNSYLLQAGTYRRLGFSDHTIRGVQIVNSLAIAALNIALTTQAAPSVNGGE